MSFIFRRSPAREDLYRAVQDDVRGRFDLLGVLETSPGHGAYLAAGAGDGALAILVYHRREGADFEPEEPVLALGSRNLLGTTTCPACGAAAPGTPRFCPYGHDLAAVPVKVPVSPALGAELQRALHQISPGLRLLGSMPYGGAPGAMHFARVGDDGAIVGCVLLKGAEGAPALVATWAVRVDDLARLSRQMAEQAQDVAPAHELPPVPDVPVPSPRRRPSRAVLAGLTTIGLAACLAAFIAVRQEPRPAPPPVQPAPVPTDTAAAAPLPVDTAVDTVSTATRDTTRGRRRTKEPPPPPVDTVQPDTALPEPPPPDPEVDRRQVLDRVQAFTRAFEAQDIGRVRAAYPHISPSEAERWAGWFNPRYPVRARLAVHSGPVVAGDTATVRFTMPLRYRGQRTCINFAGTLVRTASGWELLRLNDPGGGTGAACRELHRAWDGAESDP